MDSGWMQNPPGPPASGYRLLNNGDVDRAVNANQLPVLKEDGMSG